MPLYTVYNADTGEVMQLINCPVSSAPTHENFVEGHYPPADYKFVDGVPTLKTEEEKRPELVFKATQEMLIQRNNLLAGSDWTQLPDVALTDAKKQEWSTYRQQLRDLPQNTEDVLNITWPTQPE